MEQFTVTFDKWLPFCHLMGLYNSNHDSLSFHFKDRIADYIRSYIITNPDYDNENGVNGDDQEEP